MIQKTTKKSLLLLMVTLTLTGLIFVPSVSATRYSEYTLTVTVNDPQAGGVNPESLQCNYGDRVLVVESANPGYVFEGWYLNGEYQGRQTSIYVTMFESCLLEAVFSQRAVNLTVNIAPSECGNLSITPGVWSFEAGQTVTISETTFPNCTFDGWYVDGNYNGTANSITIQMNTDHILDAYFGPRSFQILSVITTQGGATSRMGVSIYNSSDIVAITAVPLEGYKFDYWIVNHENSTTNPMTVTMDKDQGLLAVFSQVSSSTPTQTQSPDSGNNYQIQPPVVDDSNLLEIILCAVIVVFVAALVISVRRQPKQTMPQEYLPPPP